jgi:putative NIF3 family GTP cyclohydrolase 1 type 2
MRADRVVSIILNAIPHEASWEAMKYEAYGSFGVNPKTEVRRVLFCVTPTYQVEKYFSDNKYDLLVAHHPYPEAGRTIPHIVTHTALDCCTGGLNDQWRVGLGIKNAKHFDKQLGWYGEIEPIGFGALCRKVEAFMERKILGQTFSKLDTIRSIVVCSGLGGSVTNLALATGADCYLMGEACMEASETGFNAIIETGHTNSEWIGVRLIRKLLNPHGIVVDLAPDTIDYFSGEIHKCRMLPEGTSLGQYGGFKPVHSLDNETDLAYDDFGESFLRGLQPKQLTLRKRRKQKGWTR